MAEVLEYHQRLAQHAQHAQQQLFGVGAGPQPVALGEHHPNLATTTTTTSSGMATSLCGRKRTFGESNPNPVEVCLNQQLAEQERIRRFRIQHAHEQQQHYGGGGFKRSRATSSGEVVTERSVVSQEEEEEAMRRRLSDHARACSLANTKGGDREKRDGEEGDDDDDFMLSQMRNQLVDYILSTSASARDACCAKDSLSKALGVYQKKVVSFLRSKHKQEVAELEREHSILKRAVAIQNEKLVHEKEESAKTANVCRQVVSTYQDQIRQLEVANYSLKAHLKQMMTSSQGISAHQPNRDIC